MTARQLLIIQRNSLVELITPDAEDFAKFRAKAMIKRIDARLIWSDTALENTRGLYGENGWAPEVANLCRLLEYRPSLDLTPREVVAPVKRAA